MVPGAKLRREMELIGSESAFDVAEHVASSGRTFSNLVSEVEDVVIRARPGSDILVGLEGSRPPPSNRSAVIDSTGPSRLRTDVWEAFTKLSRVPYIYQPDSDRFMIASEGQGPSIPVPEVSLEQLIRDREEFLESLDSDVQSQLRRALHQSSKPLTDFRLDLEGRGLFKQWTSAQADQIRRRVIKWAEEHDIEPRNAWFSPSRSSVAAHRTLERLIPYMTTDEIRDLKVPVRAVEALLADKK